MFSFLDVLSLASCHIVMSMSMLNYHVRRTYCFTIICRDKSESIVVSKVVIDFFFVGSFVDATCDTFYSKISMRWNRLRAEKNAQKWFSAFNEKVFSLHFFFFRINTKLNINLNSFSFSASTSLSMVHATAKLMFKNRYFGALMQFSTSMSIENLFRVFHSNNDVTMTLCVAPRPRKGTIYALSN